MYTRMYICMHVCMYVSHLHESTIQAKPLNMVPHLHRGGVLKSRQI